jgi:hypothetical protein
VAELGRNLHGPSMTFQPTVKEVALFMADFRYSLDQLGEGARRLFDKPNHTRLLQVGAEVKLVEELADVYVVCCVLATALGVDLEQIALAKATKDIKRGVR